MPKEVLPIVQNPARYAGWTVHLQDLHGMGEVFDKPTRTAIIDPTKAGPRKALAHALAHIHLQHVYEPGDLFTSQQEDAADAHADTMLQLDWSLALKVA